MIWFDSSVGVEDIEDLIEDLEQGCYRNKKK